MTIAPPAALLFDLDGTLIDSHGAIEAAARGAVEAAGVPFEPERFRRALSRPLRDMMALLAPGDDAHVESLVEGYLERYVATMVESSPPLPGVRAMLDALADVPCCVLTNKTERNARRIVEAHFGPRMPVFGSVPSRADKPAPDGLRAACAALGVDPAAAWMVGDSPIDLRTARAGGSVAVGVTWALDEAAAAALADADLLCATPDALVRAARR